MGLRAPRARRLSDRIGCVCCVGMVRREGNWAVGRIVLLRPNFVQPVVWTGRCPLRETRWERSKPAGDTDARDEDRGRSESRGTRIRYQKGTVGEHRGGKTIHRGRSQPHTRLLVACPEHVERNRSQEQDGHQSAAGDVIQPEQVVSGKLDQVVCSVPLRTVATVWGQASGHRRVQHRQDCDQADQGWIHRVRPEIAVAPMQNPSRQMAKLIPRGTVLEVLDEHEAGIGAEDLAEQKVRPGAGLALPLPRRYGVVGFGHAAQQRHVSCPHDAPDLPGSR